MTSDYIDSHGRLVGIQRIQKPQHVFEHELPAFNERYASSPPVTCIDFEGFYNKEINISNMGSRNYSKATDLYLVSIVGTNGLVYVGDPLNFDWSLINGHIWIAHNMSFDCWPIKFVLDRWLKNLISEYFKKHGPGAVQAVCPAPVEWNCTANLMASLYNIRSLRDCVLTNLGMDCSKAVRSEMEGVDYRALATDEQERVKEYCLTDSYLAILLWMRNIHKWTPLDRALSEHTIIAPARGICINTEKLYTGIDKLKQILIDYENIIPWRKHDSQARTDANPYGQPTDEKGKLFVVRNRKKIKEYCDVNKLPCPTSLAVTDTECNNWLAKYGESHPVLNAIQRHGSVNTVLQKHYSLESMLDFDVEAGQPTFIPSLLFYGAHTGRWSGGMFGKDGVAFNVQNLAKEGLAEDREIYMRSCLVPRAGHKFFIVDLSQIEPRVLFNLVGDFSMLAKCRTMSIYQAFAETYLGWKGGKLKKENPNLYLLAKAMVLGLGYGLGNPEKFVAYCMSPDIGMKEKVSPSDARMTIQKYRATNPKVVNLWNSLGRDIARAWHDDKHLELELPSGRSLHYMLTSPNSAWQGMRKTANDGHKIYGAKLCENVVQALARDCFGNCVLNLEKAGYRVMFHAHDEAICEVAVPGGADEAWEEKCKEDIERVMRIPPDFFPEIPLDSECTVSDFYCK